MKILAFILSVYILALNFAPCEDSNNLDTINKSDISISNDIEHNHNDLDLCSPFCHCQCCQVHVTDFEMIDFQITSSEISSVVYFHIDKLGKNIPKSILQPPRV